MADTEVRYGFGANWKDFVEHSLNDERLAHAVDSLKKFLRVESLEGLTVMDIGCGSGLFSLSACLLGADRVIGFDYDPNSVSTSESLRARHSIPESRWTISRNSVLDEAFMTSLPQADIVYSWGVLHHTGEMWRAIDLAAGRVKPGGLFAIAIYNKVDRFPDKSSMWWKIKRAYTTGGPLVRLFFEACYITNFALTRLVTLRNPFPPMFDKEGSGRRGMDFIHDVRDWLGGFPYEYANAGEIFQYVYDKHGYQLVAMNTLEGNACNEHVFRRPLH